VGETRRCEYTDSFGETVPGTAHQWGQALHYDSDDRRHPVTIAVVEALDGKVYELSPSEVKFVNRPKPKEL
jgi:hypothetical protein